jgi:signal transduction histidine kinase
VIAADDELRRLERRLNQGVDRLLAELIDRLNGLVDGDGAGEHLQRAKEHLVHTHADLQQIARGLRPRELDDGLPAALAALVQRCPVPVELRVEAGSAPPEEVATAIYYVCAEALANVVKHSGANGVRLDLIERRGWLHVTVTDDGAGGADPSRGSGLGGLVDRVEALGGMLTISSPTGGGTRLVADLPLGHQAG